ncbi:deoxyhypusine hydroxylase-like protein [Nannochloropsis gaditana]|uniref:Deoxyhypusine hydroxylase n=1 Tax=Nannochloropsis gaditana TaxID=72520 RepID=W7TL38_9STRA|nr:deoxyhypusine hydroxylase-like protein [Nannochloropsis gaditana]
MSSMQFCSCTMTFASTHLPPLHLDSGLVRMAPDVAVLRKCLLDVSQPIQKRTHAAFVLRTDGESEAVSAIGEALRNKQDSALLRHELAYVLGQIGDRKACPNLIAVLSDENDDSMVRHEAAEALGAIGEVEAVPVLETFVRDSVPEVADTCRLSLDLIRWRHQGGEDASLAQEKGQIGLDKSPYMSVDPAPADRVDVSTAELEARLLDTSLPLFARYRAMFSLRNRNTTEAVAALAQGLKDPSPLFRHEVAYVFGQMQNPASVPALKAVLEDGTEHRMVRHEAAEALGAVGGADCEGVLARFVRDEEVVVRESCEVALGIAEYWGESVAREVVESSAS